MQTLCWMQSTREIYCRRWVAKKTHVQESLAYKNFQYLVLPEHRRTSFDLSCLPIRQYILLKPDAMDDNNDTFYVISFLRDQHYLMLSFRQWYWISKVSHARIPHEALSMEAILEGERCGILCADRLPAVGRGALVWWGESWLWFMPVNIHPKIALCDLLHDCILIKIGWLVVVWCRYKRAPTLGKYHLDTFKPLIVLVTAWLLWVCVDC